MDFKKQFIGIAPAEKLKEMGFDEPCLAWSMVGYADYVVSVIDYYKTEERKKQSLQIPTWGQAYQFLHYLTEKYEVDINCRTIVYHYGWDLEILDDNDEVLYAYSNENGLFKLIEIIENSAKWKIVKSSH